MKELRLWGRHGGTVPLKPLALAMGKIFLEPGKHVQIFSDFSSMRPGAPTFMILRLSDTPIQRRACFNPLSDIAVVMDVSLFYIQDMTKGLRPNGRVCYFGTTREKLPASAEKIADEFDSELGQLAKQLCGICLEKK
jgi:Pyruvate/2-oxoacid:ferredoxin oxidoreductase gamma subunit